MKSVFLIILSSLSGNFALAQPGPDFYRAFTTKVRPTGSFKVPVPGTASFSFSYSFQPDSPLTPAFTLPLVSDLPSISPQPQGLYRRFWDKMLVKDGSFIQLGEEKVPITCIYISGQDNRFVGDRGTLFPEFLIRVYLVANDFTCTGPLNPGWPTNGGRRELWDTYIYYEIRDPTIMLPTEIHLRYRWAEYPGVLVDPGNNPSPTPTPSSTPGGGT